MFLKAYEHLLTGKTDTLTQRQTDEAIRQKTLEAQAAIDRHLGAVQAETQPPPPIRGAIRQRRRANQ